MNTDYIYIVISKTPSKYAKLIRATMNIEYNHASISLDENLEHIYAFARLKKRSPIVAGLVQEHASRFTLCKEEQVKIKIFKVPVSQEQYLNICHIIDDILNDQEYLYNLFSALTFPILKGFETYKAYTCIEFVMNMLVVAGISLNKPTWSYQPQELTELLKEYEFFEGNLLEYRDFEQNPDHEFFQKSKRIASLKASIAVLLVLLQRKYSQH